jgi:hypothetical protein
MRPFFRNGDVTDLAIYLIGMACVGAVLLAIAIGAV